MADLIAPRKFSPACSFRAVANDGTGDSQTGAARGLDQRLQEEHRLHAAWPRLLLRGDMLRGNAESTLQAAELI